MHEGRMQTGWWTVNAGSRLKPLITQEGTVWKASLPAVLRENPPYGMIGGIEETSASFEARSAPRSYPTIPASRVKGKCNHVVPLSQQARELLAKLPQIGNPDGY